MGPMRSKFECPLNRLVLCLINMLAILEPLSCETKICDKEFVIMHSEVCRFNVPVNIVRVFVHDLNAQ